MGFLRELSWASTLLAQMLKKPLNYIQAKEYALSQPEAWRDYPFGKSVEVFKIREKMFGLLFATKDHRRFNLKCEPEEAMILREIFPAVLPGYHMNKMHWNTIVLDGTVPTGELQRMVDNSYTLVVRSLKKTEKLRLSAIYGERIIEGLSFHSGD